MHTVLYYVNFGQNARLLRFSSFPPSILHLYICVRCGSDAQGHERRILPLI